MKKKLFVKVFLLIILNSCVSLMDKNPEWAEIKPPNTKKEIYFTFGPAETRELAKDGLYKEISEYFGIKVSSIDKFVKKVEVENGARDINQSKESQIEVEAREKGLESIQIREIWSNRKENRWFILASIDKDSEALIRAQVKIDIENERVQGLLDESQSLFNSSDKAYRDIKNNLTELKRIDLQLKNTLDKIAGINNNNRIIDLCNSAISQSDRALEVISTIKNLNNNIKLDHKKNSLLSQELDDSNVIRLEIDFLIEENFDLLGKVDSVLEDVQLIQEDIDNSLEKINVTLINSELQLISEKERSEKQLTDSVGIITDMIFSLNKLVDESKLKTDQGSEILRNIKEKSAGSSFSASEKKSDINSYIDSLNTILSEIKVSLDEAYDLKNSFSIEYERSVTSSSITSDIKDKLDSYGNAVDESISWIEIYRDKVLVLIKTGKQIADEVVSEDLLGARVESYVSSLKSNIDINNDVTVGEITIEDSEISSSFSKYMKSQIFTELGRNGFSLVDYKKVTDALNSNKQNPGSLYQTRNIDGPSIVKNVLYGNYWIKSDDIELKLIYKNLEDNRILYSDTLSLPVSSIPASFELKPANYNDIITLNKTLNEVLESSSNNRNTNRSTGNAIGFQVWPDRGSGSVYTDGEDMVINLLTPVSGYVKIYHISAESEMTLVFPNKYDTDNWCDAGVKYTIGDRSYPFQFKLGAPYGTESLKAVFSTEQFDDLINEEFSDSFLYSGVRGIYIEKQITSDLKISNVIANSYYTIIE